MSTVYLRLLQSSSLSFSLSLILSFTTTILQEPALIILFLSLSLPISLYLSLRSQFFRSCNSTAGDADTDAVRPHLPLQPQVLQQGRGQLRGNLTQTLCHAGKLGEFFRSP